MQMETGTAMLMETVTLTAMAMPTEAVKQLERHALPPECSPAVKRPERGR